MDVFVSYAHRDAARVAPLVAALRARGLSVWFDERQIDSFDAITDRLSQGIAQSKVVVPCLSETYPVRPACQWEVLQAVSALGPAGPAGRLLPVEVQPGGHVHLPPSWGLLRDLKTESRRDVVGPGGVSGVLSETEWAGVASAVARRVAAVDDVIGFPSQERGDWWPHAPARSASFTGRLREILSLHSLLVAEHTGLETGQTGARLPVVLSGLGGSGKSLLAAEYARRLIGCWPGGVIWLTGAGDAVGGRAEDTSTVWDHVGNQLEDLALSWGATSDEFRAGGGSGEDPGGPGGRSLASRAATVHRVLSQHRRDRGPVLWVLDDLPEGLSGSDVTALLPQLPHAAILITTRSRDYDSLGNALPLDSMDVDTGTALLFRHRPLPPDPAAAAREREAAQRIVRALGGHPLALDVTGRRLARAGSVATYEDQAKEFEGNALGRYEQIAAGPGSALGAGHAAPIAATLAHSLRQLAPHDDPSDPGHVGLGLLRVAAALAPGHPLPAALASAAVGAGTMAAADGLAAAADLHLVRIADAGFTTHALVLEVVRSLEPQSEADRHQTVESLRARAVGWLLDNLDVTSIAEGGHSHEAMDAAAEHALFLSREVTSPTTDPHPLWAVTGSYLLDRGRFRQAEALLKHTAETWTQSRGYGDPRTLVAWGDHALSVAGQGRYEEALVVQQTLVTWFERVLGADHAGTLGAVGNYAVTLHALGRHSEAIALEQQIVRGYERALGASHPETLRAVGNYATSLLAQGQDVHDQGLLAQAARLRHEIWARQRQRFPADHPETLRALGQYAEALSALGQTAEAAPFLKVVAKGLESRYGLEHPDSLAAGSSLADTLCTLGCWDEAAMLQRRLVNAAAEGLGPHHPTTIALRGRYEQTLARLVDA